MECQTTWLSIHHLAYYKADIIPNFLLSFSSPCQAEEDMRFSPLFNVELLKEKLKEMRIKSGHLVSEAYFVTP